jgi:hypothetical protein
MCQTKFPHISYNNEKGYFVDYDAMTKIANIINDGELCCSLHYNDSLYIKALEDKYEKKENENIMLLSEYNKIVDYSTELKKIAVIKDVMYKEEAERNKKLKSSVKMLTIMIIIETVLLFTK